MTMGTATTELPSGWRSATIGDILSVRNGAAFKSSDYSSEGVPLVRQSDLVGDYVDISGAKRLPSNYVESFPNYLIVEGDLLIGMSGSLGKISRYPHAAPALQNQRTGLLKLKAGISTSFAKLALAFVEPQILAQGRGIAVQNVSAKDIESCRFPLPPEGVRDDLAAKIEMQWSRLDASVTALKRVQANLKRYRASVLKAACEGRLVLTEAELTDRTDSATKLLGDILAMRRKQWNGRGKYREPALPDKETLPERPADWCWATIDQLGDVGTGATPKRGKSDYYDGGAIPWVTSGVVSQPFVREASEFVTEKAVAETNLTLYPAGTLIVAMYGEGKTRGKCSELLIAATTNQALAAIEAHPSIKAYLKIFLLMNYDDTRKAASGGVQPNLNLSLIRSICVPVPPLAEQHRIVAEVERRLSVIEELEASVAANLKRAERMRQAVLHGAFATNNPTI